MIILSANNITKSYGIDIILDDISFHINKRDRVGIIGSNGAGKSTLMNIISGEISPDSGNIFLAGDTRLGYLKQRDNFSPDQTVYSEMLSIFSELIEMEAQLESLSHEISVLSQKATDGDSLPEEVQKLLHTYDSLAEKFKEKNGYGYKSEINGILNSMAFPSSYYEKPIGQLSGGERTRLALAALLLEKPDVLLLDEPTNHLDIGTLKWLEQYLKNYDGTIVVISHDRYFLDQITNHIFEIENHKLWSFEGNYTEYAGKKMARLSEMMRAYEKQNAEIKRQEEMIRRFKERGTEKLAKRAKSREKALDRLEVIEKPIISNSRIKMKFKEGPKSGNDVIQGVGLAKTFSGTDRNRTLFSNVSFDIKRGERICIVGANGIGKTTLLKLLISATLPSAGHIKVGHNVFFGYYDQEQKTLDDSKTVLDELHSAYRLYNETELRNLLGCFLFKNDDVFKPVSGLSGGEKARLSLLKLMLSGTNVLVMDEPTNHLDIMSKEVFEEALLDFPGTSIIVSHDRYLLNKVPTRILELTPNGFNEYLGKYDYYEEKKQSTSVKHHLVELTRHSEVVSNQFEDSALAEKEKRQEERRKQKEAQAEQRRLDRRKAQLETEIHELEEKIQYIEKELCKEEYFTNHEKLSEFSNSLQETKLALEEKYEEWMELE